MSVIRPKPAVDPLLYEPPAAFAIGGAEAERLARLGPRLDAARTDLLAAVDRIRSGEQDAEAAKGVAEGVDLPDRLLADYGTSRGRSELYAILQAARRIRDDVDRVVVVGAGCSGLGPRLLFETCCHPFHNELPRGDRGGRPRLYFAGATFDNDRTQGLLDLVAPAGRPRGLDLLDRWALLIAADAESSARVTATAATARVFLAALGESVAMEPARLAERLITIAPGSGRLAAVGHAVGCRDTFTFSPTLSQPCLVFTAAGLLPAAIAGIDVVRFLEGAAAVMRRFREAPVDVNPVLQSAAIAHCAGGPSGGAEIMACPASGLETVGRWHDECVGGTAEDGGGLRVRITVAEPRRDPLTLPSLGPFGHDGDGLDAQVGSRWPDLLAASQAASAAAPVGPRQAEIRLPRVDEHALGQLLQLLALSAAIRRRLP